MSPIPGPILQDSEDRTQLVGAALRKRPYSPSGNLIIQAQQPLAARRIAVPDRAVLDEEFALVGLRRPHPQNQRVLARLRLRKFGNANAGFTIETSRPSRSFGRVGDPGHFEGRSMMPPTAVILTIPVQRIVAGEALRGLAIRDLGEQRDSRLDERHTRQPVALHQDAGQQTQNSPTQSHTFPHAILPGLQQCFGTVQTGYIPRFQ